MVQRHNDAGSLPRRGALAPLLCWLFLVDPHDDPAIHWDRIERECETFAILGGPCDANVGPAGVVAVTGNIEQAVARAV